MQSIEWFQCVTYSQTDRHGKANSIIATVVKKKKLDTRSFCGLDMLKDGLICSLLNKTVSLTWFRSYCHEKVKLEFYVP